MENFESLLYQFKSIPQIQSEPSYLELCQFPKRRFEEICSRLLAFFFDPKREHGFDDLFVNSFFELTGKTINYNLDEINVITEDNAEGKRIDLVIASPDFIIGIENKITADLYNPLEQYEKRLNSYNSANTFKIVLSVFENYKPEEKVKIEKYGFTSITYQAFFEIIKKNINQYINPSNQSFQNYLFDFIKTIDNMRAKSFVNKELAGFFIKNHFKIEEMIASFNKHKQELARLQKDRIEEINISVKAETNGKWWIWNNWLLGINVFHAKDIKFGIQSNFEATSENPLAVFRIYITSWNKRAYEPYRAGLNAKYPELECDDKGNRVFLHMPSIDGGNTEEIVKKLKEYHDFIVEITNEKDKMGLLCKD